MTRLALFLLAVVTPRVDRESVVGDTLERFDELGRSGGGLAARRWLWRETARVIWNAPRHRLAARSARSRMVEPEKETVMSSLWQDLRYAMRWFRRSPGFTFVAVVTLALGIGANTAIFAVVNAVLLKPLPFPHADRLMLVHLVTPGREGAGARPASPIVWSYPKYRTFLELQQIFDESGLFSGRAASLSGDGEPERLHGEIISDRYLSALGTSPLIGRSFTAEEANREGAQPVVLLGHGLWTRRYGADPGVLGRHIQLGGVTHTVVGVLPRGFRGLEGNAEWWTPLAVTDAWALSEAFGHEYRMVALRKAGVTDAAAAAAVRLYGSQIDAAHRDGPGAPWSASAASLNASRIDADVRLVALVVLGAVGFVLLIACVNLTNLLTARALTREREVAIRVALGAGRGRIAKQFAIEGITLAALGALGGLVVASIILSVATTILPDADVFFRTAVAPGTQRIAGAAGLTRVGSGMIGLDAVTFLFTASLGLLTAVLVSVLPALLASTLKPGRSLRIGPGAASGRSGRFAPRAALVALEMALSLVLLSGAGLMLKSALHLRDTNLGIDPDDVITAGLELPGAAYAPERGAAFYLDLVSRLETLPGVSAVGLGSCAPVSGGCNATSIKFPSRPGFKASTPVGVRWATPGYFSSLRIRTLQGRNFGDQDRLGAPKVAVINESAARAFFPDGDAIGQRIAVGQGGFQDGAEVIGVVADVRYRTIESSASPDVFLPLAQSYRGNMRLFMRSNQDRRVMVPAIAREVRALDPNLPLISIQTMADGVGDAMWRTRVAAWLLSSFAGLAVLLTVIGVFGVMAQTVVQRTAEFGLRMALGAQRRDVLSLVLGRALLLTGVGLATGLAASLAMTRVLGTLLYNVVPNDAATLAAVALLLGVVSILACYIPALRATRVDAVVALRSE